MPTPVRPCAPGSMDDVLLCRLSRLILALLAQERGPLSSELLAADSLVARAELPKADRRRGAGARQTAR